MCTTQHVIKTVSRLAPALTLCLAASQTMAVPVLGRYTDDPAACDNHGPKLLDHEIGEALVFPIDEAVTISTAPSSFPSHFECVPDDGIANEWLVTITNISTFAYTDLFYVADLGVTVGNYDGSVEDVTLAGSAHAFRIDGTVTPGTNNPLIFESGPVDEVLQPGETWEFTITNFSLFGTPPTFASPGGFAASSSPDLTLSNSSILATVVPEPASLSLLALGLLSIGVRSAKSDGVG